MDEQIKKTLFDKSEEKMPNDIDGRFSKLLQYVKVIRDSVHGDIWLTETEKAIIDSTIFQRLRRIKQLGTTDLVYPSAKHTRFEHSIGTLHIAQLIIEAVNRNYKAGLSKSPISNEDSFITRIVALIHDLAHIAYGHTIEDEGNLFPDAKQWLDKERKKHILEQILPIISKHLSEEGVPDSKIREVSEEVEQIIVAEESGEEEIHKLERPYIADIVGNTICADLLDYLKRDAYNTGLQITYDPRLLSYFVLEDYTRDKVTKLRLSILMERRSGVQRHDILSECVGLLRLRYSLAEKVYYHRVKSAFSAILIRMVYCALQAGIITKEDLLYLGDDVIVHKIRSHSVKGDKGNEYVHAAKKLASVLCERELFRAIYSAAYTSEDVLSKLSQYANKDQRYLMERYLEDLFSVEPGSVVIYAPPMDEGKAAQTKILRGIWGQTPYIKTIKELGEELEYSLTVGKELETLKALYKSLWRFYVLLDAKCVSDGEDEKIESLRRVCEEVVLEGKLGVHTVLLRCNRHPDVRLTGPQIEVVCKQLQTIETHPRLMKEPGTLIDQLLLQAGKGQNEV